MINEDEMKKKYMKMVLHDCNNKITEFNEICNYISQYSQANMFLIPAKYQETIINELNTLNEKHHIPLVYETSETGDPDTIYLTIFNFGVIHRENVLKELKKND